MSNSNNKYSELINIINNIKIIYNSLKDVNVLIKKNKKTDIYRV